MSHPHYPLPILYPPASKFKLTIDNTEYNFLPERLIRERHHLPLHQKFLKDNCGLALNQFDNVAWELAATTISELSIIRTLHVLKFTANEWSIGDKQQTHFQKENKCPFCQEDETIEHVFTCNHLSCITFRDKATRGLRTKMTKIDNTNGALWASLFHTAIRNLGDRFNAPHNYTLSPPPPTSWTPKPILTGYTSYKVEYTKTSGTTSVATTAPQRAPKHSKHTGNSPHSSGENATEKNVGEPQRKKLTYSNPNSTRKYQPSGTSSSVWTSLTHQSH
jgi:hypothetical protein